MAEQPEPAPKPLAWRTQAAPVRSDTALSARDRKRTVLLGLLLAVLGAGLAWALYPRQMRPAAFVSLAVREYDSPRWPANPFAVQDSDALAACFAQKQQGYANQGLEQFHKFLRGLRESPGEPLVIHLTALARAEGDEVFLLPGDASPEQPAEWVGLGAVLEAVRACPARHKLLLLDLMRPLAHPRLGLLADDVADAVHARLAREEAAAPLTFFVFCACGHGAQQSFTSQELQRSVFAHYLERGLRGRADGHGEGGRPDRRITVRELAAFVAPRVDRWAWHNRGRRQTPVLWGDAVADFALLHVEGEADESATGPAQYPDWLRQAWQVRDRWREDGTFRTLPPLLPQVEASLLRLERRWRGGIEEERLKDEAAKRLERWDKTARAGRDLPPPASSLRLAAAPRDAKAEAEWQELQAALAVQLARAAEPKAKPEPADKEREAERAKAREELLARLRKLDYAQAASLLVETAAAQEQTPARLLFLHQLLLDLPRPPAARADHAEIAFLKRLKAFLQLTREYEWPWPAGEVRQAFGTALAAESACAALAEEPAAVRWVAPLFEQAEAERRQGERLLFATDRPSTWPEAVKRLAQAEQWYHGVVARTALVRQARRQLDDAYALLPAWADLFVAQAAPDPQAERAWQSAARAARELAAFLAAPEPEALAEGEPGAQGGLRRGLEELQRTLRRGIGRAARVLRVDTAAEYQESQALLDSPLLTAKERDEVWQAGRGLAQRLHEESARADDADGPAAIAPGDDPGPRLEQARQRRRASYSLELLRLAGHPRIAELDKQMAAAVKGGAAEWRTLAGALGDAWTKELPGRLASAQTPLAARDGLARLLPLADGALPGVDRQLFPGPADLLRQQARANLLSLLGRHYQEKAPEE